MYQSLENVSIPGEGIFGDLLERPRRTGAYPMGIAEQKM